MMIIRNLSKTYRKQKALDNVCLEIPSGHIFALLGPNGSGKTTLLKSVLGLVRPESLSEIIFEGESILHQNDYKKWVGYMPQHPQFPPHLTVCELISFLEKLRQTEALHKKSLMQAMQMDVFWNKTIGELSGGMAQKVNILQCFMFDHRLLVLDEPSSGLDPHAVYYLKQIIREKKSSGATILFTSHIPSEVDELADELAFLIDGRVYSVTSPEVLKQQSGSPSLEKALHQLWDKAVYE